MMYRLLFAISVFGGLLGGAACSSAGEATRPEPDAGPAPDPQAGQPWVVDEGGGFCSTVDALAEDPGSPGRLWLTAGETMVATFARDTTTDRFRLDPKKTTTSVVTLRPIGNDVFVSLAGSQERLPRTLVYSGSDEAAQVFSWPARRIARSDSGCIGGERFVSNDVGTEFVVRRPDGSKERTLPLPHYEHWPLFLDGMLGLPDSLLVLANRNADARGALYRVSCATLDHELIASGESISLLHAFTRGAGSRIWAVDGAFETRRVVQSDDGGATWQRAPGLLDFVSSRIFARENLVVVTGAYMNVVSISTDSGATWRSEGIQTFSKSVGTRTANSVLVASDGTLFVGGACNTLAHRRLRLK